MQRRRWLQLGLGAAALLAIGGTAVSLVQPGLDAGRLAPAGRLVMRHVARGVLHGTLPADGPQAATALDALLQRLDALVGVLPPHAQAELSQLLSLLATSPGRLALAGLRPAWEQASVSELQHALQGMRTAGSNLRQQGYQALHDLTSAAWFSDPSTWTHLGYPGPRPV